MIPPSPQRFHHAIGHLFLWFLLLLQGNLSFLVVAVMKNAEVQVHGQLINDLHTKGQLLLARLVQTPYLRKTRWIFDFVPVQQGGSNGPLSLAARFWPLVPLHDIHTIQSLNNGSFTITFYCNNLNCIWWNS